MPKVKKIGLILGLFVTILYLALTGYLLVNQRQLTYKPRPRDQRTPADYQVPFSEVKIPLSAVESLSGWWITPNDNKASITLVYCHGNSASLSSLTQTSSIFYRYGWNVLLYDYRGYGNSPVPDLGISEESLAADAVAAYDWAVERPESKGTKIVVWGHSLGSAVAARLSESKKPEAVILEGTMPGSYQMARYRYPWAAFPKLFILDQLESGHYLENNPVRKLFIHGDHDRVIPIEYGRMVYEQAAEPKEWITAEGIGHNGFPDVEEQYRDRIMKFVNGG